MENYLFLKEDSEAERLSLSLGFTKTLFLGRDLALISGTPKELISRAQEAKRKGLMTVYEAEDEIKLRLALEKVPLDIIIGMEKIFPRDSVHFPKSGVDQILCKIAAEQGKALGFSFSDILKAKDRAKLMGRMRFNLGLCKQYKVKIIFNNFSRDRWEMRSTKDLEVVRRVLERRV